MTGLMPRTIIHLDLDAFFCAVEELNNPGLRGRAFAVGGRPEERGVVASCSYVARKFGIRSAMPMARAVKLCPELLIISSHHSIYSKISQQVMERIRRLTPLVEQVSIDEAFMDATGLPPDGLQVARTLQANIREELKLPSSLGVATNKLVAKIATDVGKASARMNSSTQEPAGIDSQSLASYPNAITMVPCGQEADFLAPLPVEMLWGVGPKTAARLSDLGVTTIGDLAQYPVSELKRVFGKIGIELSSHARGLDDSPIITQSETKSISQETTFARDIRSEQALHQTLLELSTRVGRRLRQAGLQGTTVKIKLRWPDFTTLTRQVTLAQPTDQESQIFTASLQLFSQVWVPGKAVRLLGVGVSGLGPIIRQLSLWDETYEREHRLNAAIDSLWEKFGPGIIQRGGVKSR